MVFFPQKNPDPQNRSSFSHFGGPQNRQTFAPRGNFTNNLKHSPDHGPHHGDPVPGDVVFCCVFFWQLGSHGTTGISHRIPIGSYGIFTYMNIHKKPQPFICRSVNVHKQSHGSVMGYDYLRIFMRHGSIIKIQPLVQAIRLCGERLRCGLCWRETFRWLWVKKTFVKKWPPGDLRWNVIMTSLNGVYDMYIICTFMYIGLGGGFNVDSFYVHPLNNCKRRCLFQLSTHCLRHIVFV